MGIIVTCGSYLLATWDRMYKVLTVKARTEEESFSAQALEEVVIHHQQYCCECASSERKGAAAIPAYVPTAPDSTTGQAVPRRTQLRNAQVIKHGFALECPW